MATKKGTAKNDTIAGSTTDNPIFGYNGNDIITTAITTGTGLTAYGGGGNDSITSGATKDKLFGGDGADTLSSGGEADKVYGGNANDVITLGDGADYASGDAGNDTITGGSGKQSMLGGAGNNSLNSGTDATATNKHYLYGGAGNDTVVSTSSSGMNYLYGAQGNNSMVGSTAGKDTIQGGVGTNTIVGNAANHANITVNYENVGKGTASAGVTVNLTTGAASATWNSGANVITDTITVGNVDHVTGSQYYNSITGSAVANKILAGIGNDTIDVGGDSTTATVTATNVGNDTIIAGYGNNSIVMHTGTATASSIDGGLGTDTVNFTNVSVLGTAIATSALPAPSAGTYTAGTVSGVYVNLSSEISAGINMKGGAGDGKLSAVEKVIGTEFTDYIVASGSSTINGGAGNDTIVATQTANANGPNVLIGGLGNDVFDGTSSSFKDYYAIGDAASGVDTIYGFNNGSATQGDKLYISLSGPLGTTMGALSGTITSHVDTGTNWSATYNSVVIGAAAVDTVIMSRSVNASTVNSYTSTTLAAGNSTGAEFVFDEQTGALWVDTNGSTAGGQTQIAVIDLNTFTTAHTTAGADMIDSTDFVLVA